MRILSLSVIVMALTVIGGSFQAAVQSPPPSDPYVNAHLDPNLPQKARPIPAHDTVFLEEMTWLEVRDALKDGNDTVIIATGGIEQNGPYLALGKHNYILRALTDRIARKLGNALVAPIVPFVPEGDFEPASGAMRFPGSITVRQETFVAMLTDIAESMRVHRFKQVILLGDSRGNQEPMKTVAETLSRKWQGSGTSIHYIPEYYFNPQSGKWLKEHGIHEVREGYHDDFRHSSIMLFVDPNTVRMKERMAVGKFSINSIPLAPIEKTRKIADQLIDHQADVTIAAIRKAFASTSKAKKQ